MSDVQACGMDVVSENSNHQITGMAVSVCLTPAVPSPLPIPYPTMGMSVEGIVDPPMRSKIDGVPFATVGSCAEVCHGNEPGVLKEVLSLNTSGPSFPLIGAPTALGELGMMAITGSPCQMNKAITIGAPATASDAGGTGSAGSGAGGGGANAGNASGPSGPSTGGGSGGGGSSTGASANPNAGGENKYCPQGGRAPPADLAEVEDADLRTRAVLDRASPRGREAAIAAISEAPGGAADGKGQAFWSGPNTGKPAAQKGGLLIQEDVGGAKHLEAMDNVQKLEWKEELGEGSNITGERLWKTISIRSAENAEGGIDACVVGTAWPGNVFSSVELPTLLHREKLDEIRFRDPAIAPPPGPVVSTWKRDANKCWVGPPVQQVPPTSFDKAGKPWPPFKLIATGIEPRLKA